MPAFDSAPTGVTGSIAPAASARRRFVDASGRLRSHSRRERSSSNEDYDDLRPNLQAIVPGAHGGGVDSIPQPRTTTLEVDNEPVPDQDFRVRGVREWLDNGEQREEYLIDADDLSLRRLLLDDTSKVSECMPLS